MKVPKPREDGREGHRSYKNLVTASEPSRCIVDPSEQNPQASQVDVLSTLANKIRKRAKEPINYNDKTTLLTKNHKYDTIIIILETGNGFCL